MRDAVASRAHDRRRVYEAAMTGIPVLRESPNAMLGRDAIAGAIRGMVVAP
jgi:hypothetical protein